MHLYKIRVLPPMSICYVILFSKLMVDIFNPFNDWTA